MPPDANEIRPFEITLFTKIGGPLSKRISLTKDGRVHSDGSACRMARGEAQRLRVAGLAEFAGAIDGMKSNQAIALGTLREGLPEKVEVTTKYRLNGKVAPNVIARTANDIIYRSGRPALMLLDHDTKDIPTEISNELQRLGGFWPALATAVPELKSAGRVMRRSTSAGLFRTDIGERLPGSDGVHIFVQVLDGSDVERALRTLHDRCWLAGLGWLIVGAAGQLLERSIVDRMVGTSERLVFEGPPIVVAPLGQDNDLRRPQIQDGDAVDTIKVIQPLTITEAARLLEIKSKQKQALADEATRVRATYIAARAKELVQVAGITPQAAFHIIARQCEGVLLPDVVLPFDEEELAGCTVGDVLADPMRFEGATLADPVEGVDYGRCCAKIMVTASGAPWIHSFAHGRTVYDLRYNVAAIRKLLEQTADADVLGKFVQLDAQAEISETELEDLVRYIKTRTGNGIRVILRSVNEAREQRAKRQKQEQHERRLAERDDPRPQLGRPACDAPWLPAMETVLEVVGQAAPARKIKRDIEGVAMQPRRIVVPRTHAFSNEEDEE